MKQSATYCYGSSDGYRRMMTITVADALGSCTSHAYEEHAFPGVVRWLDDNQCVPAYLCEAMGWGDLNAQREAISDFQDAMQQIMTLEL